MSKSTGKFWTQKSSSNNSDVFSLLSHFIKAPVVGNGAEQCDILKNIFSSFFKHWQLLWRATCDENLEILQNCN